MGELSGESGDFSYGSEQIEVRSQEDEVAFRRTYPVVWVVTLVGPFVLTAVLLFLIRELAGTRVMWRLVSTAAATFFFFGKFVILGGNDGELAEVTAFFTAEQLFLLVFYMDIMTASLLAFHLGFVFRMPVVGKKLRALAEDGQCILKSNSWMKRATFLGLIAFVMFPLAATGSVGGSIFGRLLGMSAVGTFAAIVLGNLIGCSLMYFGSELITRFIGRENPLLLVGGMLVIGGLVFLLNHRYREFKRR